MDPIIALLAMVPPPPQHLSPLEAVARQSPYFKLLRDHGAATRQALDWIEGAILVLGVGLNSLVLLLLLLSCRSIRGDVGKPFYQRRNKAAIVLVANLCLVDLLSTVIMYLILPSLLSKDITDSQACALTAASFCIINFSITLSTALLCAERWVKIAHFQKHPRMFSLSSTVFLVVSCWMSTLLYSLGTYLLISPPSKGPGVHTCRISSLPAAPYLLIKPALVILSSVLMFSMYIDILKRSFMSYKRRLERRKLQNLSCRPETHFFIKYHFQPFPCSRPKLYKALVNQMSPIKIFVWFLAGCNKYIICILITYSTSWLPWILAFLTDTVLVHTGFHHSLTLSICGQFSLSERDIIHQKLQNGTVTSSSLPWSTPACAALALCYEEEAVALATRLVVAAGASSVVLDPVIYALWFPLFQKQVWQMVFKVKSSIGNNYN